ncbi:MAG TPA: RNA-binding protein [Paraburkholderia sp.]|jgi:hypothetical protein|nr:RNA-binding protein [Paraburkholderia sp.]
MTVLYLGNVAADTSDEAIAEFLGRYGFPPFDAIDRVADEGPRPAARVVFNDVPPELLRVLQRRIHDVYWRNRRIVAQVLPDREE